MSFPKMRIVLMVIIAMASQINAEEPAAGPADAVTVGQIEHIRRLVGADSDTLMALRVDENQARLTLSACNEWVRANLAHCHLLRLAVVTRLRDVRETVRRVRVGPAEPEHARTLALQREALARARQAYVAFVREGLGPCVDACLTPEQRQRRLVLVANEGLPMPYRALSLNDDQRRQLGQAHQQLRQAVRTASGQDERQAAIERFKSVQTEVLSPAQQAQLAEIQADMATSSENISQILASDLPAPSTQD